MVLVEGGGGGAAGEEEVKWERRTDGAGTGSLIESGL